MSGQPTQSSPLVTIVTPSFNQARFIRETIESVLSQDYENTEYIIMDGASADGTAQVVRPYLDRLTFISEPDDGQSHAINKGFMMARGSIVAWLNSDDVLLPGAISKAVAILSEHPEAAAVYGEGYQIDANGTVKQRFPYTQHFDRWKLIFLSDYILQQTVFFRKAALDSVGPLREDLDWVMDWDILIRLAKRYELVYAQEYFGSLREHGAAKTAQGGAKRRREILAMLRRSTHMMIPPGYVIYALPEWLGQFEETVGRWSQPFQPLGNFIRRICRRICYRSIGYAMRIGQRWDSDGWMASGARVMLSEGNGEALLRGSIPNAPGLISQRITVRCGGRKLSEAAYPPGRFEIRVVVPETPTPRNPILTVEASESFRLSSLGGAHDERAVSLRLEHVGWARPRLHFPLPLAEAI